MPRTVTLDDEAHRLLVRLKYDLGLRNYSQVILVLAERSGVLREERPSRKKGADA